LRLALSPLETSEDWENCLGPPPSPRNPEIDFPSSRVLSLGMVKLDCLNLVFAHLVPFFRMMMGPLFPILIDCFSSQSFSLSPFEPCKFSTKGSKRHLFQWMPPPELEMTLSPSYPLELLIYKREGLFSLFPLTYPLSRPPVCPGVVAPVRPAACSDGKIPPPFWLPFCLQCLNHSDVCCPAPPPSLQGPVSP